MAKIVLDTVTGGYDLSVINNNFDKIETEFQNKVLYRDNPVGEANTLQTDVDANGKRIFNLPTPTLASEAARLQDIQNALAGGAANLISFVPYGNIAAINMQAALQEEIDDLASTGAGKGASLIGVQDAGNLYSGSNVETVLQEIGSNRRTKLLTSRTYYVRTDGDDANSGLADTAGGAFLTIQKAVNIIRDTLDLNGFDVTIQVRNGAYTAGASIDSPWAGDGDVFIIGDTTTPSNITVTVTSGQCFATSNGARLKVRGFKVSTVTSGNCLQAYLGSNLEYGVMDFGACAGNHVECGQGSTVISISPYTISGGAIGHWHCGSFGFISISENLITLTGTPAFSAYFAGAAQGTISFGAATFSGTATGKRFVAHHGGLIRSSQSETALPGTVAGESSAAGAYIGGGGTAWKLAPDNGSANSLVMQSLNFNAQTYNTHFQTINDLFTGKGYFFTNGDDCFSSGRTHFAGTANVDVASGTTDGWTMKSLGFGAIFHASANGNAVGYMRRRTSNGDVLGFFRDTTPVGSISVTTTNTAYNTSSDRRLKTAFAEANYDSEWIKKISSNIISYEFKNDLGNRQIGVIAQDLHKVAPEAVTPGTDNLEPGDEGFHPWAVDPSKLIWKLLQEVAELRRRLDCVQIK